MMHMWSELTQSDDIVSWSAFFFLFFSIEKLKKKCLHHFIAIDKTIVKKKKAFLAKKSKKGSLGNA